MSLGPVTFGPGGTPVHSFHTNQGLFGSDLCWEISKLCAHRVLIQHLIVQPIQLKSDGGHLSAAQSSVIHCRGFVFKSAAWSQKGWVVKPPVGRGGVVASGGGAGFLVYEWWLWGMDQQNEAFSLMKVLLQFVLVKYKWSGKAKLSIDWSVYVPTFTYEVWIMTERMRSSM